jgi:transposase InsO family protein
MDFITDLALSDGCNQLWVIIDRLPKMAHFISLKKNDKRAENLTLVFANKIWRLHGIPTNIVLDWDSRFTSKFWKALLMPIGVKTRMSTAVHLETNGQTERLNQTIVAFLRAFINLEMGDWVNLVPRVEFAYNNSRTTTTGHAPFYANYRFYLNSGTNQLRTDTLPVSSKAYGNWMTAIYDDCCDTLEKTRKTMKKYMDSDRAEPPNYSKGELVMLSGKNIRTRRHSKKLAHKLHGPFEIIEVVSETAMRLNFTVKWKIHKVFHDSLLEPFIQANREVNLKNILDTANPIKADDKYQVEEVMGSVKNTGKISYLLKYRLFTAKKDWTRENY